MSTRSAAPPKTYCVVCDKEAITTAAHIPVCEEHWLKYKREAEQYLAVRPFWELLQQKDWEWRNHVHTNE